MEGLKHTKKIREYCDYIDTHLRNVEKAWRLVQDKCNDLHPLTDDFLWDLMDTDIKWHDVSKMSPEEFIPYQRQFFPVGDLPDRKNEVFAAAWEHHKEENPHHWENWTRIDKEKFPNESACHCVMMVCDWIAMGFQHGDTAAEFYARKKSDIRLPKWADKLVCDIFDRIYT